MSNTHLDMTSIIQEELKERRANRVGSKSPRPKLGETEPTIRISEENGNLNVEHGPQQVESLLQYVIGFPVQKAMDDAEDDADAISHLMARKEKKKKKKSRIITY